MTDSPETAGPGCPGEPTPLNDLVHDQMSRMPRRDTKPELALRRELHRRGLRFRVDYRDVPGRPDIALTRARIAVFIDGCFWHRCPLYCRVPKNNRQWWRAKLDRNAERDRETFWGSVLRRYGDEMLNAPSTGPMSIRRAAVFE